MVNLTCPRKRSDLFLHLCSCLFCQSQTKMQRQDGSLSQLVFFYCCDETSWPKSKLGRKGFIWFTLLYHCSSSKEVRTRTQTGQEPGARSWCRDHKGVQRTDFLIMAHSACFLIELTTTCPGLVTPTVGWTLPYQSLINKMPTGLFIAWSYEVLSFEASSSPMTLACVKLT